LNLRQGMLKPVERGTLVDELMGLGAQVSNHIDNVTRCPL
jgi:hypothetical protein